MLIMLTSFDSQFAPQSKSICNVNSFFCQDDQLLVQNRLRFN